MLDFVSNLNRKQIIVMEWKLNLKSTPINFILKLALNDNHPKNKERKSREQIRLCKSCQNFL